MLVVAGLTTGHKIGLAIVAALFIAFAIASSLLMPRRRPDYPGKAGLSVFMIVSLALFAATIAAIEIFGAESDTKANASALAAEAGTRATVQVQESGSRIVLVGAGAQALQPGRYTFVVHNVGTSPHDLWIEGPEVSSARTPLIQPGKQARLTVALGAGRYALSSTVSGRHPAGTVKRIRVS